MLNYTFNTFFLQQWEREYFPLELSWKPHVWSNSIVLYSFKITHFSLQFSLKIYCITWSSVPEIYVKLWRYSRKFDEWNFLVTSSFLLLPDSPFLFFTPFSHLLPPSLQSSSPAVESSGPQVSLQLLLAPLAGLHVEVLEDVVFALGADLRRWHLQRVVVQRDALEMPEVAVAQGHMGNAVAGHVEPDKGELGYFWMVQKGGNLLVTVSFGPLSFGYFTLHLFTHT